MLKHVARRGVTLVELLVGLTIVSILLGLGVPSFAIYLQSSKLASTAQSYLSGVQLARAEAIRRNLPVQFVLTNTAIAPGIETAAVPSANGLNWVVRWFDPNALPPAFQLIEAKPAAEGAFSAVPSVRIVGVGAPTAFAGIVVFNGLGGTALQDAFDLDIDNPAGGACSPGGPMRCLRIRIPAGGLVNLCDPIATAVGDSRRC